MTTPIYTKRRLDGWPLCPQCGDDELYCTEWPATIERIVGCYCCGWRPGKEPVPSPNRSV